MIWGSSGLSPWKVNLRLSGSRERGGNSLDHYSGVAQTLVGGIPCDFFVCVYACVVCMYVCMLVLCVCMLVLYGVSVCVCVVCVYECV